jgi:hypothetical protein
MLAQREQKHSPTTSCEPPIASAALGSAEVHLIGGRWSGPDGVAAGAWRALPP